ncbi:MAG: Crp/Fnr family transcriptional regulator [Candidatus Omnitrophota bacterium]|jgi:CRP/FNR family transcriptional regulator
MDIDHLLEQTAWFKGLSAPNRETVAAACLRRRVKKKEIVFLEGDRGESLFLLAQGSIRLYKAGPGGREAIIRIVKPGEIFAEVILFEKDRYPVTSVALKDSILYALPRAKFHEMLKGEDFRRDFIRLLLEKHRYLTERIVSLTSYDVETRLFRFLRDQFGELEEITPGMSKKDVANAVGAMPETFSRLLMKLRRAGALKWEDRVIRLKKGFWKKTEF